MCKNLRKVDIGEQSKLRTIGDYAFCHCGSLTKINLPGRLEKVGVGCFSYCGLEEITLPASVREVGAKAFYYCEKLKAVQLNEDLKKYEGKETVYEGESEG